MHSYLIMFKSLSFAVIVLLSLPPAFAAPPRMDSLTISQSEAGLTLGCALDKLCVEIIPSQADCEGQACPSILVDDVDWSLRLSGGQHDPAHTPYGLSELSSADAEPSFQLWPTLIRFEGGILAGVETQLRASLDLTEVSAAGMPVLRYRSEATSFPGPVSRFEDSLAGRPLSKSDIVTVTNPLCSYHRLYSFDPEARGYIPV